MGQHGVERAFDSNAALKRRGTTLAALPNPTSLDAFARELAGSGGRWQHCRSHATAGAPIEELRAGDYFHFSPRNTLEKGCQFLQVNAVGVEVWRYDYDRRKHALVSQLLADGEAKRE